jgi:tetratricopeptide (TPR) repeat protein
LPAVAIELEWRHLGCLLCLLATSRSTSSSGSAPTCTWKPLPLLLQIQHKGYRSALEVAKQLQAAMRDALADGKIFVLPTTPGPAPPLPANPAAPTASEQEALRLFRQRCAQFAAIASLTGGPQVVVPLPVPGAMPLSVSLLAAHKRDLVLAEAAAKIGPMLAEEAATLVADQKANRAQQWQPAANPAPDSAGGSSAKQPATAKRGAGKRGAKGSEEAAAAAAEAAEARKEDGNKAYRAGRYDDAVRFYSAALLLSPRSAVYHGNRAMANLKLGEYGAAEADCDQALKLELSAKTLLRRGSARLAQVRVGWGAGGPQVQVQSRVMCAAAVFQHCRNVMCQSALPTAESEQHIGPSFLPSPSTPASTPAFPPPPPHAAGQWCGGTS